MRIKPANRYKTRTGRRIAVVWCSPLIPVAALLYALGEFLETFRDVCKDVREVWNK